MALVNMNVHCGCGARFDKIAAGIQHGVETGHKLDISGTIDPKTKNLEAAKEAISAPK